MKLIDEWKDCLKRAWSIRLAALFAALAAAMMANPGLLLGLINFVPERLRPLAAAATFIVTFALPTLTRLMQQKTPDAQ